MNVREADVCVIGGGPGGLSAAAALALRGRRVVQGAAHIVAGDALAFEQGEEFSYEKITR